jgi:hypothetical protein
MGPAGDRQRPQIEAFLLAFSTNLAPVVGQQITLTAASSAAVSSRLNLLRQRADAGECDLVTKVRIFDDEVGFLYVGSGAFTTDRQGLPSVPAAALRSLATDFGARLRQESRRGPRRRLGRRRATRSFRSGGSGQQALSQQRGTVAKIEPQAWAASAS